MGDNRDKIARFADRLVKLADDYRDDRASVAEDAKKADIDPAALGRLVSWMRKDRTKRAEQEAIDEQYRFLAGETETPATLPAEGMLSEAARLYRDKLSVRQVAGVLNVSTGKAFKLKALAALFTVHADVNTSVNAPDHDADGVITDTSPKAPDASSTVTPQEGEEAVELPNVTPIRKKPGQIPVNLPFERLPQFGDDPGFGAPPQEPRSPAIPTSDSPEPVVPTGNEGRAGERGPEEQIAPTESLGAVARPSSAERVASTINPDEDDLTIPEFLRGTPVAGNAF